jgi:UDP-N-acetylglucosamine 2-epimerase (non-hydrolysing)/GDP/UDP-N,N'-diacetylbacillosamine 2-epimerase (hydrolysing)
MKRILAISGSRADYGLLEWPVKVLRENFEVYFEMLGVDKPEDAYHVAAHYLHGTKPDCLLILGDRWEILQAAIAAHLRRVPIAHIGGGDVTLGSYDDAMRDCISRLATWHFVTNKDAFTKVYHLTGNVYSTHMIGNIAIDYIRHGDWKRERPIAEPYVVVSYQPETIDGTVDMDAVYAAVGGRRAVWIKPNMDAGSERIPATEEYGHAEFLNLLYHADEFIGNSSAMLYEAPELGVKCRMIGKRQAGRVAPTGDGKASERIREVLCRCL